PIDPKRDEYRRYLERGGIIESLTKVFVRILKERPEDPTQYLLQNLGDARLQADNIAYLQSELEEARNEIQRLTEIIRGINPELLEESSNSNNDCNNECNVSEGVISAHEEPEVTPCLQKLDEQNIQPERELSEGTSLEGLQNTQISESNVLESGEINGVQNEVTSSAE
ncbi:hypothetical protein DOY81_005915, partial [Sarcophaga bullata]